MFCLHRLASPGARYGPLIPSPSCDGVLGIYARQILRGAKRLALTTDASGDGKSPVCQKVERLRRLHPLPSFVV